MEWLIFTIAGFILIFGFVVLFGPPYIPTLTEQMNEALDLLDLSAGQTMLELGSGDGRVVKAAAKRGWKVVGYELNPILVVISIIWTWPERRQVKIIWGNFWSKEWPPADGIFNFLLGRQTGKLDRKIKQYKSRPLKVANFAFRIQGKNPKKESKGVFLYEYR